MWVVRIIVVELCRAIPTILTSKSCSNLHIVVDLPIPCQQSCRSEVVNDTRVSLLTVLVTPIRVVSVVVSNPIHFVGRSSLRCTFGRVAPCGESKRMFVVFTKEFLHTEIVRKSIIECSLYITLVCPTISDVGTNSPTLRVESAVIGVHTAYGIVAVSTSERYTLAYSHVGRTEVVVVTSCHVRHVECIFFERHCRVHVSCLLIQTTNKRIAELTCLHIVHWRAIDVDIIVFLIKGAIPEPYWREQISHLRGIDI